MIGTIIKISAPDDHLTAGPHCCGKLSASGRAGGTGGSPSVSAGIISTAGIKKVGA